MNTQEIIEKAKLIAKSDSRKAYGTMQQLLMDEVSASGKNYYTSQMWKEHEATVRKAISEATDRNVRKALEGLLL